MFATLDKNKLAEGGNLIEMWFISANLYWQMALCQFDISQASGILLVFTCLI